MKRGPGEVANNWGGRGGPKGKKTFLLREGDRGHTGGIEIRVAEVCEIRSI